MSRGAYEKAKRESAARAQRIRFGHPSQWPLPTGEYAEDAFERGLMEAEQAAERDLWDGHSDDDFDDMWGD